MSRRNGKAPKVDLKLNLTRTTRAPMTENSPRRSATLSPTSPPSSCISSEMSQDDLTQLGYYSSSPEAQSMVLAGWSTLSHVRHACPRMTLNAPNAKTLSLLEFMQQGNHHSGSHFHRRSSFQPTRPGKNAEFIFSLFHLDASTILYILGY
ncbi:unnamed protein product [Rhodiola kirilowii]